MKVIDLLNKIANGEEVPERIKYEDYIWEYDKLSNDYEKFDESGDLYLFGDLFAEKYVTLALNDEVEIIEEDKKIEKSIKPIASEYTYDYAKKICNKINEIIDYLNKEK